MYVVEHEYGSTWTYRLPGNGGKTTGSGTGKKTKGEDGHDRHVGCARITFYDANHCPGACIILIQLTKEETVETPSSPRSSYSGTRDENEWGMAATKRTAVTTAAATTTTTTTHLHTGDMRYDAQKFQSYPLLREAVEMNGIDIVYLDTTYSHPKHDFCPQEVAVEAIASQTEQLLLPPSSPVSSSATNVEAGTTNADCIHPTVQPPLCPNTRSRTLVLLSCYSIGKEKVLWEASRRTNQLVYVTERKYRMLQCLQERRRRRREQEPDNDEDASSSASRIIERCTRDPSRSDLHVIPMGLAGELWPFFRPNFSKCAQYVQDLEDGKIAHHLDEAPGIGDERTVQPSQGAQQEPRLQASSLLSLGSRPERKYDKVVAFIPTGWANGSNWNKRNARSSKEVTLASGRTLQVEIRLISYSEHSAFHELASFVEYLKPRKVVPTVFSDEADYRKIHSRFCNLLDSTRAKQAFLRSMRLTGTAAATEMKIAAACRSGIEGSVVSGKDFKKHEVDTGLDRVEHFESSRKEKKAMGSNLATMVSMGFDRKESESRLEECDGDMARAIDTLLSSCPTVHEPSREPMGVLYARECQGPDKSTDVSTSGTPPVTKRTKRMSPSSSGQITDFFPSRKASS